MLQQAQQVAQRQPRVGDVLDQDDVLAVEEPELVPALFPQEFMETIIDREAWFERIRNSPLLTGIEIGLNNIMVSFKAFLMG